MKIRKIGERVSWAASPTAPDCRTVYTGEITEVDGALAYVRDDGWGATSGVRMDMLHDEGAFEILRSGPRGIRWTDR